ncbi:carbamoyl-phosphate synthase L chain, ATP-binding domain protein [Leptospira broomii serovar Hurstbridge str. 5399]|uniref:Carbamoyl-phosphate synthase L chain, ATP-binding domain protein n=1 Tax=Leptospira broomii serovar Hurstbridge str. 5399 TaxID=1049789 RepID=T0GEF6_9LEPT|nr:carboxyl transferase domain-containing protein [Leptospira broomii]EQA43788.1 carbamoyl-phosphate synthase L chain, ATP-binding domain protein [Leptospira broomii serovar Hurstbridge str. 5399]
MNSEEKMNIDYICDFSDIESFRELFRTKNKSLSDTVRNRREREGRLQKVLIANRGEIAKRFFLALHEEGIRSVAVVADQDRGQSWFEFADEVIYIGEAKNYANIPAICAAILESGANAVYPGYGFLSENYHFVDRLREIEKFYGHEIIFMGPKASVMRSVGNKLDARNLAIQNGIPLFQGSGSITGLEEAESEAKRIGFPVILKLDAGGGGKGMIVIRSIEELPPAIESAVRIGRNSYGNDTFYLEKYIEHPAHFEVQIFNGVAVGIRKCAVQRRNQKIIEESGESFLPPNTQLQLLSSAEKLASISGYSERCGAGTVEFLLDRQTGQFGFLEMNTRLQVEYAVTDQSLGIDLAKWQIFLFDEREQKIPYHSVLRMRFRERDHSIQCRIYAEDPYQNYSPSPGKIRELELPTFNGIRCDFGFKKGDVIPGDFDPMIGKLVSFGKDRSEALLRMERALSELYLSGITSNIEQLLSIVRHHRFIEGDYDNRLLEEYPELTTTDHSLFEESVIFACVSETLKSNGESVSDVFRKRDLIKILYTDDSKESPYHYKVWIDETSYHIFLLRIGLREFLVGGDSLPTRKIQVSRSSADGRQFLAESNGRSVSVRIDAKPNFHLIRFSGSSGKLHYSRLRIASEDQKENGDEQGVLRSPFQGTFVKLFDDPKTKKTWAEGSVIKQGDPLLVISAMKMETILKSPADGVVSYLIENGNLSKLVRGATAAGQVLGKSFSEGEVLAKIRSEIHTEEITSGNSTGIDRSIAADRSFMEQWNKIPKAPEDQHSLTHAQNLETGKQRKELLRILYSLILGFSGGSETEAKIANLFNAMDASKIAKESKEAEEWAELLAFLLKYVVLIRRLFSSDFGSSHSHFGELQRSLLNWDTEGFKPYKGTSRLLSRAFSFYDVKPWVSFRRLKEQGEAFYFILIAYKNLMNYPELYSNILEKLSSLLPASKLVNLHLHELLALEERERDPMFEAIVKRILSVRKTSDFNAPEGVRTLSKRNISKYIQFMKDPWTLVSDSSANKNGSLLAFNETLPLIQENISERMRSTLDNKLEYWKGQGKISRLDSMTENKFLYSFEVKNKIEYILFSFFSASALTREWNELDQAFHFPELENQAISGAALLRAADQVRRASSFRLELIAVESETLSNARRIDPSIDYETLNQTASSMMEFFLQGTFSSLTLEINDSNAFLNKRYSFFFRDGKLRIDSLGRNDFRFPYAEDCDSKDRKLYEKGKWPLERWVEESFDPGSFKEVLLAGLDFDEKGNSDSSERIPIGAKIYIGHIAGSEAVFFLKDSRIAGGATGDKEGKKYLAGAYIAYRKDVPFYVWNDGAGANIKEGMVSLNRAAEGFFINALLAHRVNAKEFQSAIRSHNDLEVRRLCDRLEKTQNLGFRTYQSEDRPKFCFVVAVGVGSSTGLDVYGSSQASLQVLLDEEQSYRVLTGAAVIESVTGETFTNYEIGGAKIMGRGTGTVDFVANDKLHLISYIRKIQSVLKEVEDCSGKLKIKNIQKNKNSNLATEIISESELRSVSDSGEFLPIKANYSGSESLVTGMFRFGGMPITVLGPRTEFGFHSFAALVKAKETLRIAQKTGTGLLLVYGKKWFRSEYIEDSESFRVRKDFQKLLQEFSAPLLHIVKDTSGISITELSSVGDAWILVRPKRQKNRGNDDVFRQSSEMEKAATIVVDTDEDAYSKAASVFQLIHNRNIMDSGSTRKEPGLPEDSTKSYDMRQFLVESILDLDSFVEFYASDSGTSLITGLGRIFGRTVGIIADQPKDGGAPDAYGTDKFRVFMEFLNKYDIPLVMLSDAPGFVPGTKQERLRIQQIGGESLDVNVLSQNPVVSIVLRQNYGGRQIHAFSGFLRPGISYYSWSSGTLAVMGAFSAFDLFQGAKVAKLREEGKTLEIENLRKEFLDSFKQKAQASNDAFNSGVLDGVFESLSELRSVILDGLDSAKGKRNAWMEQKNGKSSGEVFSKSDVRVRE